MSHDSMPYLKVVQRADGSGIHVTCNHFVIGPPGTAIEPVIFVLEEGEVWSSRSSSDTQLMLASSLIRIPGVKRVKVWMAQLLIEYNEPIATPPEKLRMHELTWTVVNYLRRACVDPGSSRVLHAHMPDGFIVR